MKIDNRTAYSTRDLRSILCAVHTLDAVHRGGCRNADKRGRLRTWSSLVVVVRYARRGDRNFTGHAYYHGRKCTLSIPRRRSDDVFAVYERTGKTPPAELAGACVRRLAALWQHELWHLYGIRHPDYPPTVMHCVPGTPFVDRVVAYLAARSERDPFPAVLLAAAPVERAKPTADDKRAAKIERLVERRDAWLAKERRAATALAKIERSLRRYERLGLDVPEAKAARPKRRRRSKR